MKGIKRNSPTLKCIRTNFCEQYMMIGNHKNVLSQLEYKKSLNVLQSDILNR